jgi:hypothetical protein
MNKKAHVPEEEHEPLSKFLLNIKQIIIVQRMLSCSNMSSLDSYLKA